MKKNYLLGILFFSGLWGMSEAGLGGILYRAHIPHASVPLTVIGFIILSLARVYLPQKGSSTLIGAIAMLYKFLNAPFFACHLLAIFLLGLSYDVVFSFLAASSPLPSRLDPAVKPQDDERRLILDDEHGLILKDRPSYSFQRKGLMSAATIPLFGLSATYLGYILFALTITYVFRYHYWIEGGLPRILRYIGIGGTMAGLGNYLLVPRALRLGQRLKEKGINPFGLSELLVWLCSTRNNGRHKCRPYNLKPGLVTAERKIIRTAIPPLRDYALITEGKIIRTAIPPLRDYALISGVSLITAALWILGELRSN